MAPGKRQGIIISMKSRPADRPASPPALPTVVILGLSFAILLLSVGFTAVERPPALPAALDEGMAAPDFSAQAGDGRVVSLADLKGQVVVLYFYPKNDTPVCTEQACRFRDAREALAALGATVVGVSRDDVPDHRKFRGKYGLNFPTLADPQGKIHDLFGAWKNGRFHARTTLAVDRSTFLIDRQGAVRRIWRGVAVQEHTAEVLAAIRGLS